MSDAPNDPDVTLMITQALARAEQALNAEGLFWILDAHGEPQRATVATWSDWMTDDDTNRIVAHHEPARGQVVSTVFLGLDHNWMHPGPPVLFETMIVGGPFDHFQLRYRTRQAALAGHAQALALIAVFRSAPRKTRKALRKVGRPFGDIWLLPTHLGPRERIRLSRAAHGVRRLTAHEAVASIA